MSKEIVGNIENAIDINKDNLPRVIAHRKIDVGGSRGTVVSYYISENIKTGMIQGVIKKEIFGFGGYKDTASLGRAKKLLDNTLAVNGFFPKNRMSDLEKLMRVKMDEDIAGLKKQLETACDIFSKKDDSNFDDPKYKVNVTEWDRQEIYGNTLTEVIKEFEQSGSFKTLVHDEFLNGKEQLDGLHEVTPEELLQAIGEEKTKETKAKEYAKQRAKLVKKFGEKKVKQIEDEIKNKKINMMKF